MKINIQDVVAEFKFSEKNNTVATANISIGQFELRGFRVVRTKFKNAENFALFPPSRPYQGGYWDVVRVPNKEDWKELSEFVLKKFNEEYDHHLLNEVGKSLQTPEVSF